MGWSLYSHYRECPVKFYWEHVRQLTPKTATPAPAARLYGALWHAMYQARFTGIDTFMSAAEVFEENRQPISPEIIASIDADLDWYFAQERAIKVNPVIQEVELRCAVGNHEMRGTPDLIAEVEGEWGGGLYVIDHKTYQALTRTGAYYPKPRDATVTKQIHSRQYPFYMAIAEGNGIRIRDGLANFIPQEVTRVLDAIKTKRGTPDPPRVRREFILCNDTQVSRIKDDFKTACDEIQTLLDSKCEGLWRVRENPNACVKEYGMCPWLPICEMPMERVDNFIANVYDEKGLDG